MHQWINDHIEWVLSLLIALVLAIGGLIRRHVTRISVLETRLDCVEDDLKDGKSARLEQMILMRKMQENQQEIAQMIARIDERTARADKGK